MEQTLPDNHPDMIRIKQAAHHDITPAGTSPTRGGGLAGALAAALGGVPGDADDQANIEFLVHVLAVNRAAGSIDDETFEILLQRLSSRAGRDALTRLFTTELENEHGYAVDEDSPNDDQPVAPR